MSWKYRIMEPSYSSLMIGIFGIWQRRLIRYTTDDDVEMLMFDKWRTWVTVLELEDNKEVSLQELIDNPQWWDEKDYYVSILKELC